MHIKLFKESAGVNKVVTTEISDTAPGIFSADICYRVPRAISPEYPHAILKICKKEAINAIIPLLDLDIAVFSKNREMFESEGITFLLSPNATIDIALDKLATANFLGKNGLPNPKTIIATDWEKYSEKITYPILIKPRFPAKRSTIGYDISVLHNNSEVKTILNNLNEASQDYVFQEYLQGTELTVDFFCDNHGNLVSAVPGERLNAMSKAFSKNGGAISEGRIFHDDNISAMVRRLTEKTRFFGPGNFQAYRLASGDIKITEINPRMTGATVMTNASGMNFFQWSIDLLMGKEVLPPKENFKEIRMSSWMHPVFYEKIDIQEI